MRIRFLIFIGALCFAFTKVNACLCMQELGFKDANIVFSGKLIKEEILVLPQFREIGSDTLRFDYKLGKYTFAITESFKGLQAEKQIVVYSGANLDDCGYYFEQGKSYIVFVEIDPWSFTQNLPQGPLNFTNECTETALYTKAFADKLRKLK